MGTTDTVTYRDKSIQWLQDNRSSLPTWVRVELAVIEQTVAYICKNGLSVSNKVPADISSQELVSLAYIPRVLSHCLVWFLEEIKEPWGKGSANPCPPDVSLCIRLQNGIESKLYQDFSVPIHGRFWEMEEPIPQRFREEREKFELAECLFYCMSSYKVGF